MKYLFILLSLITLNCNNSKNNKEHTENTITTTSDPVQNIHYSVNIKFTVNKLEILGSTKQDGALNLLDILPPTGLFLCIYKSDKLVYYTEFPDPLNERGVGDGRESEKQLTEGNGTINFPGFLGQSSLAEKYTILILQLVDYDEKFAKTIKTQKGLKKYVSSGIIDQRYVLDSEELAKILQ